MDSHSLRLKIRYGWSKHGGSRIKGITEVDLPEWVCQICGEKQTQGMPFFELPFVDSDTEFVKICASCEYDRLVARIKYVHELLSLLKK